MHVTVHDQGRKHTLELELQTGVSHLMQLLGPDRRSPGRASRTLNCWAVSPALQLELLRIRLCADVAFHAEATSLACSKSVAGMTPHCPTKAILPMCSLSQFSPPFLFVYFVMRGGAPWDLGTGVQKKKKFWRHPCLRMECGGKYRLQRSMGNFGARWMYLFDCKQ